MSRRTIAIAIALIGAGLCAAIAFGPRFVHLPGSNKPAPKAHARAFPPPPPAELRPTVAERLERLDGRLRLPPDGRVLAAMGEIHRLATGSESPAASASWSSGSWKITDQGRTAGMVSSYPSFAALLSLLDETAAREKKHSGLTFGKDTAIRPELASRLARFDDETAFEVLAKVDAAWGEHKATVGDLLAATDALAQLYAITPSTFRFADALGARALASLALARAWAPEKTLRAEAYLARRMGYAVHTKSLADRLAKDDPLAMYLHGDMKSLEREARKPKHSAETDFLYGSLVTATKRFEDWQEWYQKLPRDHAWRPALLRTAVDDREVPAGHVLPEAFAACLLTRFGVEPPKIPREHDVLSHYADIGDKAREKSQGLTGPFAPPELFVSYYEATYLAAAYLKARFFLDSFGSPEGALELAQAMPEPRGPGLAELVEWVELLANKPDKKRLAKAIESRSELGIYERARLTWAMVNAIGDWEPQRMEPVDSLEPWLDSRGEARDWGADFARDVLFDPDLETALSEASSDVDGVPVSKKRRDWAGLWAIAESDDESFEARRKALWELQSQEPLDGPRLRAGYEKLIVSHSDDSSLRAAFATLLEDKLQDRAAARAMYMRDLEKLEKGDIGADNLLAKIARLYRKDGDPAAGWKLIEPRLEGMVGSVLAEGAREQIALGNLDRAEKIARSAYTRYPDSSMIASILSSALWEQKRHKEAAQVIKDFSAPESDNDRCWSFCRAFVASFKDKPIPEAEAAFQAMFAAKIDYGLLQGSIATLREEPGDSKAHAEMAFALGKRMDFPEASMQMATEAYISLKIARGEEEALKWIATQIPRGELGVAAKLFFYRGADELLWKLVDDPDHMGGSAIWLLRAAGFLREKKPDASHKAALETYYTSHQQTTDDLLGAAMVGLVEPDAVLARVRIEQDVSRVAFYLGLRAESHNDLHEAMRFYRLAITSPQKTEARNNAYQAAFAIHQGDLSLDDLAAERAKARSAAGS